MNKIFIGLVFCFVLALPVFYWIVANLTSPAFECKVTESDFIVFREDSTYFAVSGTTKDIFSGKSFVEVIDYAIENLQDVSVRLPNPEGDWVIGKTGYIFIKEGNYTLDSSIHIPLGSIIRIEGVSSNQEHINNGMSGGTNILSSGSLNALTVDSSNDVISGVSGTQLTVKHIQFIQTVDLTSSTTSVLNLDGMARGLLEDVQVVKADDMPYPVVGTGIRHQQFDDSGGYTTYSQVQVVGFEVGMDARINHWTNIQGGIANCTTGLIWQVCAGDGFYNLHMQEVDQILREYEGFGEPQIASIWGLYLEGCGNDADDLVEWWSDNNFGGMIKVYNTNAHACSSNIWTWNAGWRHWYVDVFPSTGTPNFPPPTNQPISNATWIKNSNPQTVMVYVYGGEISSIEVNGVNTHISSGSFQLRPSDQIRLNYTVQPKWNWRGLSGTHMEIND